MVLFTKAVVVVLNFILVIQTFYKAYAIPQPTKRDTVTTNAGKVEHKISLEMDEGKLQLEFIVYEDESKLVTGCIHSFHENFCFETHRAGVKVERDNGETVFDFGATSTYSYRKFGNRTLVKSTDKKSEEFQLTSKRQLLFETLDESRAQNVLIRPDYNQVKEILFKSIQAGTVRRLGHVVKSLENYKNISVQYRSALIPLFLSVKRLLRYEVKLRDEGKLTNSLTLEATKRPICLGCGWSACAKVPLKPSCLGMCGPGCFCWRLICGDCCYHQGCYEHDECCRHAGILSFYCLGAIPFLVFTCESYLFYPFCLATPTSGTV